MFTSYKQYSKKYWDMLQHLGYDPKDKQFEFEDQGQQNDQIEEEKK